MSCTDYIEFVLRKQLIQAIGKELTVPEFSEYMDLYLRKILKAPACPQQFSVPVRTRDHHPDGIIMVTRRSKNAMSTPILVTTRCSQVQQPFVMALDASTRISFVGNHYIHGHLAYAFSDTANSELSLDVSCNRFGCFVLVIGRIHSPNIFEPKSAIVLQGKGKLRHFCKLT